MGDTTLWEDEGNVDMNCFVHELFKRELLWEPCISRSSSFQLGRQLDADY